MTSTPFALNSIAFAEIVIVADGFTLSILFVNRVINFLLPF